MQKFGSEDPLTKKYKKNRLMLSLGSIETDGANVLLFDLLPGIQFFKPTFLCRLNLIPLPVISVHPLANELQLVYLNQR